MINWSPAKLLKGRPAVVFPRARVRTIAWTNSKLRDKPDTSARTGTPRRPVAAALITPSQVFQSEAFTDDFGAIFTDDSGAEFTS